MGTQIDIFLSYFEKVHERTAKLVALIPPTHLDWTYMDGRFTIGDMVRHIAATERYMYAETTFSRPSLYVGCDKTLAATYDEVMAYYHSKHEEAMMLFNQLTDEDLIKKCTTPAGIQLSIWKWLRAMTEHEIHHRGQLYIYLSMIGVKTPPVFGLTEEELSAKGIMM